MMYELNMPRARAMSQAAGDSSLGAGSVLLEAHQGQRNERTGGPRQPPPGNTYFVRTLTTVQEVESIRPIWSRLQTQPDGDIDSFLLTLRLRREVLRPHVLLVYERGEPICIA